MHARTFAQPSQLCRCKRVKRTDGKTVDRLTVQQRTHAIAHGACGFVRKRERQHTPRCATALQQRRNAPCHNSRLARSRSGQDKHGSRWSADRLGLGSRKALKQCIASVHRRIVPPPVVALCWAPSRHETTCPPVQTCRFKPLTEHASGLCDILLKYHQIKWPKTQ